MVEEGTAARSDPLLVTVSSRQMRRREIFLAPHFDQLQLRAPELRTQLLPWYRPVIGTAAEEASFMAACQRKLSYFCDIQEAKAMCLLVAAQAAGFQRAYRNAMANLSSMTWRSPMQMRSNKKAIGSIMAWMASMLALTTASLAFARPQISVENGPRIDPRIIGGHEVSRGKYPFMASLQSGGSHFCGGSLYYRDVVITAAHCVNNVTDGNAAGLSVTIGQTLLSDDIGAQRRGVSAVAVSTVPDSDLALIFLDAPVSGVVPVSLPTLGSDALYRPGQFVTVMGWGNTDPDIPFFPDRLRAVDVPLLAHDECAAAYGDDLSTYFCAGARGQGACHGDSGSPIIRSIGGRVYQIGVVSFGGLPCAAQGEPAAYVDLSSGELWNSLKFIWVKAGPGKQLPMVGSGRR